MINKLLQNRRKPRKKGQAIVETALGGLFLALLLAGAVDLGRAYHTAVVVENMAGEGASYAAKYPAKDIVSTSCSETGVLPNQNIQDRARRVASDRGIIIRQPSQANIAIDPPNCVNRCRGVPIKVTVTYQLNDLLLPNLLGMSSITVRNSSTQYILENVSGGTCPP
jgi:Flp pilus assembly protein TadG